MVFKCLNDGNKITKECDRLTHDNYMKFKLQGPYIKVYWNLATCTNLLPVQAIQPQWQSQVEWQGTCGMQAHSTSFLALYRSSLLILLFVISQGRKYRIQESWVSGRKGRGDLKERQRYKGWGKAAAISIKIWEYSEDLQMSSCFKNIPHQRSVFCYGYKRV